MLKFRLFDSTVGGLSQLLLLGGFAGVCGLLASGQSYRRMDCLLGKNHMLNTRNMGATTFQTQTCGLCSL